MTLRAAAKETAFWIATLLVLPSLASYRVRSLAWGRDRALEGSTQAWSLFPGIVGQYLRRAFLARTLACCDQTVVVEFGTIFSRADARIGARVYVGPRCHLGLVDIEQDVLIGAGVHVPSGAATHGTDSLHIPIREQPGELHVVHVGSGCWIGSGAIVMADVGRESVVGAGSVVSRPIPDGVVAAGVPAKVIRSRGTVMQEALGRSGIGAHNTHAGR